MGADVHTPADGEVVCDPQHGCTVVQLLTQLITRHDQDIADLKREDQKLHDRVTKGLESKLAQVPAQLSLVVMIIISLISLAVSIYQAMRH